MGQAENLTTVTIEAHRQVKKLRLLTSSRDRIQGARHTPAEVLDDAVVGNGGVEHG